MPLPLSLTCAMNDGVPTLRPEGLLSLTYCCCHELELSVICHCWTNMVTLTSKHRKASSWENPDLPSMFDLQKHPCHSPSPSLRWLFQDPPHLKESFSGCSASPASPTLPSTASALASQSTESLPPSLGPQTTDVLKQPDDLQHPGEMLAPSYPLGSSKLLPVTDMSAAKVLLPHHLTTLSSIVFSLAVSSLSY